VTCVSGLTGADLKHRTADIMTGPVARRLTLLAKPCSRLPAALVVTIPVLLGVIHAQSDTFEVASVKPADPSVFGVRMQFTPSGGVRIQNGSLMNIIVMAYGLDHFQISGNPAWLDSEQHVIDANGAGSAIAGQTGTTGSEKSIATRRLHSQLAERFHLAVRADTSFGNPKLVSMASKARDRGNSRPKR
jgi:bla regulator protein blaR1